MTCESLLRKAERQLSSNDIIKGALTYLKSTESLLNRQRRCNEISEENYKFRTDENKGVLLGIKKQKMINALKEIRKQLDLYKNKYKPDTIDAGPSKIVEIIEIEAGPSIIVNTKSSFEILLVPEILAEIANNLHPRNILNFLLKLLLKFPELSELEARVLYEYKKCLYCNKEFIDPLPDDVNPIHKEAIIKAIYSVDFMQLQGSYLSFNFRYDSTLSHVLFFLKKDIEMLAKKLYQIQDDNLAYNWLQEKENIVHQYQKNVLKAKHTLINDNNMEMMLNRATFYIPSEYSLSDNLTSIRSYI
ncbi:20634_t:CDS:2 [Gigaspora rosea]|nr:20634_t:CDS:2 [Gigaspora rosea]